MTRHDDRPLVCRTSELFSRDTVHQSAEGLDVLSSRWFAVHERRLLYDDVQLVTLHLDRGVWYLVATGLFGLAFVALGVFVLAVSPTMYGISIPLLLIGIPALVAMFIRLVTGREVVTVHGRRSKAVLRFSGLRKKRARDVYGQICSLVRRAQSSTVPGSAAPLPRDSDLPPLP
jgi:hypothetical protein